jgi:alcohol dehydrogenase
MRAVRYEQFAVLPEVVTVADPTPQPDGVVIAVEACGVCRSDWHGWMGHDPDIRLPHVPGHELAGRIVARGRDVAADWQIGDRVTVPFVCACGSCEQCRAGQQQVCDRQEQPGFTHWGGFAEYVPIARANVNLVRLPDQMSMATAASLGCRFATSFRAVVDQGRVSAGEWVVVYGCGGVGLSAIMIAAALGAQVIGVDITAERLASAARSGAQITLNSREHTDIAAVVRELTGGGAHVSIDALGHPTTAAAGIMSLRTRGRHVQVGLLLADQATPALPMARVIARELTIVGSHGMQAHRYDAMLAMIAAGRIAPQQLIGERISLSAAAQALAEMDRFNGSGVTVITDFRH